MTRATDSVDAALVTVGDELLLGRTVDGNAAWLGRELADLGMRVTRRFTVGDEDRAIRQALARALEEAEVVVLTGGLGPTPDDRTREAVAGQLRLPLDVDPALLGELEARFRARGYEQLPETNVSQAQVPRGAQVLPNPRGTAPGLSIETGGRLVVLLPGVPAEMRGIFAEHVRPLLVGRHGPRLAPVRVRTLRTTGIPESVLSARVAEALPEEPGPVSVAFLPELTGVDVRLTAAHASPEEAERWLDRVEAALAPALEDFRYEAESGDLVEAVARALVAAGRRLAVAESCTGGLVAKRITDHAGASEYFAGGVIAYADAVKVRMLGVGEATLSSGGAVSEAVAVEMARGVARGLHADVGLAVTGVAGPGGGTAEKPVGTVWYAVSVDGEATARRELFPGDREAVRVRSAQAVLALLLRRLEGRA